MRLSTVVAFAATIASSAPALALPPPVMPSGVHHPPGWQRIDSPKWRFTRNAQEEVPGYMAPPSVVTQMFSILASKPQPTLASRDDVPDLVSSTPHLPSHTAFPRRPIHNREEELIARQLAHLPIPSEQPPAPTRVVFSRDNELDARLNFHLPIPSGWLNPSMVTRDDSDLEFGAVHGYGYGLPGGYHGHGQGKGGLTEHQSQSSEYPEGSVIGGSSVPTPTTSMAGGSALPLGQLANSASVSVSASASAGSS